MRMPVMVLPGSSEQHDDVIVEGWAAADVRSAEHPLLAAGEPLMARAAAGLADEVRRVLAARGRRTGRIVVLVGSGDNGGDALLATADLLRSGSTAVVVRLGRRVHAGGFRAAQQAGAQVLPPDAPAGRIATEAAAADVVLDGVLGIGGSGGLRAPARQVVARLAESGVRAAVVAVDLPSGLGADDGVPHPPMLRADRTVTFGAVKAGLLRASARPWVGRVLLVDIGLGPSLARGEPLIRVER
jgi:NAD(P)H-hydrate epimerase